MYDWDNPAPHSTEDSFKIGKVVREYGITMDIILGNHDTYFKNTNDLNSLKELKGHYMN